MSNSSESLLNLERRLCSPFQLPRDLAVKELKLKNSASDMCLLLQSGKISSKVKCGLLRILLDIELNANDAKELLRKIQNEPSLSGTYLVKSVLYLCTKLRKMEGLNYSSATTSVHTLLPLLTIYEKNDGRLSIDDIVVGSVDALLEGYADFDVVSALVKYFWVDSKGQEFLVKFIDYFEYSADETENYAQLSSSMRELIVSLEKSVALHLNGMSRHRVLQFLFEDLPKGSILILLENSMNDDVSIPVILSHVPFLLAEKLLTEVELLLMFMLYGYIILDGKIQSEEAIGDMLQIMILIYSSLESGEFATVCKCARIPLLHVLYKKKLLEISSTDDEHYVYKSAEKLARDISSLGFIKSGTEVADKVEKYLNETNLNGSIHHAFVSAFASEGLCIDSSVALLVLPCFDSQDLKSVIKSCDKAHFAHLMCYLVCLVENGEEPDCQRILLEDFPQLIKESNNDSFLMSRIMSFCSEFDIYPEFLYQIIHCNSRVVFGQLFKKLKQTILKISDNSIEPSRELLSACGILLKISEEDTDFLYTKEIIFLAKELIAKATNTNRSAESIYEFVFYVGARVTLNFCNNSLISFEEAQAILKPSYSKWQFKIALNIKEEIRYYGLIGKFVLISQHEETNLKRIEAVKTLCTKDFLKYEEDVVESLCMFETYELINFFSESLKPKEEDQVEAPEITTESIILYLKTRFSKSYHKLLSKFIDEEISQIGRAAFKRQIQTVDINRKRYSNPFANFHPSFKGVISFDSLVNGGGQNLEVELDTALLDLEDVRDLAFLTESSQYDLILQHDMVNIEGFKRFFLNNLNESNYIVFLHKLLVLEVNVNYSYALAGFMLALSDMKMFSMVESQVCEYYHVSVTQKLSQLNSFQVFALILSITTVFPHCSSSNTVTNSIRDAIHKLYNESSDSIARYITSYFIGANCSYMNVDHLVSELKKAFMLNLTNKRTVVEDTLVIDAETILGFGGGLAHAALTRSEDNVVSILRGFNVEIFIMSSTPENILVSNQRLSLLKVGMLFCQILHENGFSPALTAKFSEISEMEQLDFYSSFYDYKFGKGTVFKTPGASLALLSALRYVLIRDLDGLEKDLKKMVKMQSGNKYAYMLYSLLVSNRSNAASGSVFNEPPNYDRFQSSSYIKTVFDLITKGHQLDLLKSYIIYKPLPLVNWTFILQNVTDQSLLESFCSAHVYNSLSVQIYVFNNFTKFNYETLIAAASCLLKENNHMVSSLALKAAFSHIIQAKNGEVNHILRLLHSSILANVANLDNNLIEVFADMAKNIVEHNLSNLSEVDDVSLETIHFVAKAICVVDVHQEMKKNQVGTLLQLNIMLQLKEYNQAIDLLRKADLAGRASFFKYIELSRLDAKEIYTVVMRVVDYILLYNAADLFDVLGALMIKSSKPEVDTVQFKVSEDLYPRIVQDYMEFMKSKSLNSEDFKIKIATLVSTQMKNLVYKFDSILQCDALKQTEINLLASLN